MDPILKASRTRPRAVIVLVVTAALLSGCAATTTASRTTAPSVPQGSTTGPPRPSSPRPHPTARQTAPPKPHHHRHPHHSPHPGHPHPPSVPAVDVPDPALTPGVAFDVGRGRICVSGYSASVRDVPDSEKAEVYARYHVAWVPYQHEVDHLVSLEIGGSNAIGNLWPEPYAGRWGARTKDVLEDRLHDLVCDGRLSLHAAQRQEATNWVAAYRRYVGTPPAGSGSGGSGSGGASAGGYYASRYPTARTIYCADDPTWKELSKTYLVHFHTFTQARARFPTYHLHRPC